MAKTPPKTKTARAARPSAPNRAFVRKDAKRWKQAGWTSVPNSITRDEDLPPIEMWAWTWLASHTEEFEVSGDALWHANKHVGRDKAYQLLRNLEQRGLLLRSYEVNEQGVPYIVYDLQPEPVPEEQRTTRPTRAKTKSKRAFPTDNSASTNSPGSSDSWTVRKPTVSSKDPEAPTGSGDTAAGRPGFLTSQETGSDQGQHDPDSDAARTSDGGVFPDGSVPDGSGESYKEEKTKGEDQPPTAVADGAQATELSPAGQMDGWNGDPHNAEPADAAAASETSSADSTGVALLQGLGISPAVARQWGAIVDRGIDSLGRANVDQALSGGGRPGPGAIVSTRLPQLQARLETAQADRRSSTKGADWCGECGSHYPDQRARTNTRFRLVLTADGQEQRCTCHPKHPSRQQHPTAA